MKTYILIPAIAIRKLRVPTETKKMTIYILAKTTDKMQRFGVVITRVSKELCAR